MTPNKNLLGSLNEELSGKTIKNRSLPFSLITSKNIKSERLKKNLLIFTLLNLLWLIFRSGTKPSRLAYPCQRVAVDNISKSLGLFIPLSITSPFLIKWKHFISKNKIVILGIILLGVISSGLFLEIITPNSSYKVQLKLESQQATIFPASDIYVVNGADTQINRLINLMGSHGMIFYNSSFMEENQGPNGLISRDDVILLKINSQWSERGGTNTDILFELIQAITNHPDGFIGEIIVADNGQGRGNMNYASSNAENHSQSTQDIVNMFSSAYNVSTYDWQKIRSNRVDEYSEGDLKDGYILYDTADPETGIYVSYPKFKTEYGTFLSFKHGIWNGTEYEKRLKVINLPVLKSHSLYGVTASIKNYMGVQSEIIAGGLGNGHNTVATGGMGTLLVECGLPTLNIIDAIWVNANPVPSISAGPSTSYKQATRLDLLLASTDPVALDFWSAKHILIQTAKIIGYENTNTFDPDNSEKSGLIEAFGIWLNLTREELIRGGFNVTTDENRMSIFYDTQNDIFTSSSSSVSISSNIISTKTTPGFDFVLLIFGLFAFIPLYSQKQGKSSN